MPTEKQQLVYLVTMALVCTAAVTHSVVVHIKEANKRKLIRDSVKALDKMKLSPEYINAPGNVKIEMIDNLVTTSLKLK